MKGIQLLMPADQPQLVYGPMPKPNPAAKVMPLAVPKQKKGSLK